MTKLFFDIGNTKIKVASISKQDYQYLGSFFIQDFIEQIDGFLFEVFEKPDSVFYSSVASAQVVDQIKSLIQSEWQLFPVRLESQQSCCGLTSGYQDFDKLGVDRWLAMLGTISQTKDPFLVIDCGTAITVDAVIEGQHKGGFIVPGLHTQIKSLSSSTADINDVNLSELFDEGSVLATNTDHAIWAGTLYMVSSYINQIVLDLNMQMQTQFKVFLTGGDAHLIQNTLHFDYKLIPDLVLKGAVYKVSQIEK